MGHMTLSDRSREFLREVLDSQFNMATDYSASLEELLDWCLCIDEVAAANGIRLWSDLSAGGPGDTAVLAGRRWWDGRQP